MIRACCNTLSNVFGMEKDVFWKRILSYSLRQAAAEQGFAGLCERLRRMEPRIVAHGGDDGDFWELKRRLQHAFQCAMMLDAVRAAGKERVKVVDIGGTGIHMSYLQGLAGQDVLIDSLSVNISAAAIEQVRARGQRALHCRGEEVHAHLKDKKADLFVAFETLEHLHNPALFLRRLATHFDCPRMAISVPYRRQSRVGLFNLRQRSRREITAGDEHIFELCPDDWKLLMLHAGWRVREARVLYQYPRSLPVVSRLFARLWRNAEFEGFFGAILEKDTVCSDRYKDWE